MKIVFQQLVSMTKDNSKTVLARLFTALLLAIIVVAVMYLVYDYAAVALNHAIDNRSIGFLQGFDLKAKLYDKCGFDGVPSAAEIQSRFGLFYKIFLFWFAFLGLLVFAPWKRWKQDHTAFLPRIRFTSQLFKVAPQYKRSTWALILSIIALYAFWYWIISLSGMLGDDYYCGMTQGKPFITRFAWWVWCYVTHVSRIGESIYYIFPQTIERTQHLLITPLFVALFPFVIKRFSEAKFKMNSWRGVVFYWAMGVLAFMGIVIIRILIIYAPCTNYFYPVVLCLLFWSFYLNYKGYAPHNNHSTLTIIGFTILGVISGWATEGMAAIGIILLTIWLFYWVAKEKIIPKFYYMGLIGYLIGACNVVFSTGPAIRGALDPRLTGGNVPYNLTVLPFCQRFTYLPELYQALWECITVPVCLILLSIALICIFRLLPYFGKRFWQRFLFYMIIAMSLATVYIVGAVPNGSTFTPSSYIMVAAFGLILARMLEINWKVALTPVLCLIVCTIIYMYPRIKLGLITSRYDKARIELIKAKKAAGEKDIELPYPLPFEYKADRTYIPFQHFSPRPSENKHQATFFGVHSIKEEDWKKN